MVRFALAALLALAMTGALRAHPEDAPRAKEASANTVLTADSAADELLDPSAQSLHATVAGQAEPLLREKMRTEPSNPRWPLALGVLTQRTGDAKGGRALIERAIEIGPGLALAHYHLGNAIFAGIDDAGIFAKAGMAKEGRKAYERAIELDGEFVQAMFALAMFHRHAPGIVGGSKKKAHELGEQMLAVPGGGYLGNTLLGQMAASDKDWTATGERYEAAAEAADTAYTRAAALGSLGYHLLIGKQDAQAAIAPLEAAREAMAPLPEDNPTIHFLLGRAYLETNRPQDAIEPLSRAIRINADAENSRFYLAEALHRTGDIEGASREYAEYLRRFPKGAHAKEAKKAVGELRPR